MQDWTEDGHGGIRGSNATVGGGVEYQSTHHEPIHTQPVEALTNPPAASRRERGSTGAFPSYAADHGEHGTLRERCRDGQKPPLPPSSNPSETKLEVSDNSS